jgi:hypothetical protein
MHADASGIGFDESNSDATGGLVPVLMAQMSQATNDDILDAAAVLCSAVSHVLFSAADTAIRDASAPAGSGARKCFGCGAADHLWFRCPQRNDPTVAKKARLELTDYIRNRDASRAAMPVNTATTHAVFQHRREMINKNWKGEGFPTKSLADLMLTVTDPTTDVTTRASCLHSINLKAKRGKSSGSAEVVGGPVTWPDPTPSAAIISKLIGQKIKWELFFSKPMILPKRRTPKRASVPVASVNLTAPSLVSDCARLHSSLGIPL